MKLRTVKCSLCLKIISIFNQTAGIIFKMSWIFQTEKFLHIRKSSLLEWKICCFLFFSLSSVTWFIIQHQLPKQDKGFIWKGAEYGCDKFPAPNVLPEEVLKSSNFFSVHWLLEHQNHTHGQEEKPMYLLRT